jgi:hypothetical protein
MPLVALSFIVSAQNACDKSLGRGRRVSQQGRKEMYASSSNFIRVDRCWRPSMVSEPVHPHGGQHQVDFECSGGHLRGGLASQCVWIVPLSLPNPHWVAARQHSPGRGRARAARGSCARISVREGRTKC